MPKNSEVKIAFINNITQDSKRGSIVTTVRFVQELAKLNHFWSLREANDWIDRYQTYFRDYTDRHGDDKCYFMMNMGYVM